MLQQVIDRLRKIYAYRILPSNESLELNVAIGMAVETQKRIEKSNIALHEAQRQCAQLAGKVACLEERLDYWMQRARSHEDEDGYPLHEIHRAYGVESVDKGVD